MIIDRPLNPPESDIPEKKHSYIDYEELAVKKIDWFIKQYDYPLELIESITTNSKDYLEFSSYILNCAITNDRNCLKEVIKRVIDQYKEEFTEELDRKWAEKWRGE